MNTIEAKAPNIVARLFGWETLLRQAGINRLQAQSLIARIKNGEIAHHAPPCPVILDASPDPLANVAAFKRAFPRGQITTRAESRVADLAFAAFGCDTDPTTFAHALRPGAAFALVGLRKPGLVRLALQKHGLVVVPRRQMGGLAISLAGFKPIAAPADTA